MDTKPKKKFRLFDAVLMSVVVIMTVESVALQPPLVHHNSFGGFSY